MAQEDDLDLDVEKAAAPKSRSKLLIIIAAVVLILGISATATVVLTGMLSQDEAVASTDIQSGSKAGKKGKHKRAGKSKARLPLNYVPMSPPFVVNFGGDSDIRFLQLTLEVGTRNPEAVDAIKEQSPAIRNSLVMLFSGQDPSVLNTREGKEKLRAETLAAIQKVMRDETGDPSIDSVFFTSFVMQ